MPETPEGYTRFDMNDIAADMLRPGEYLPDIIATIDLSPSGCPVAFEREIAERRHVIELHLLKERNPDRTYVMDRSMLAVVRHHDRMVRFDAGWMSEGAGI